MPMMMHQPPAEHPQARDDESQDAAKIPGPQYVTVPCSYCQEPILTEFRHGAVMPNWHDGSTATVFVPNLVGAHVCKSKRAKDERDRHVRYSCVTCGSAVTD